jgi:hypothetical protein
MADSEPIILGGRATIGPQNNYVGKTEIRGSTADSTEETEMQATAGEDHNAGVYHKLRCAAAAPEDENGYNGRVRWKIVKWCKNFGNEGYRDLYICDLFLGIHRYLFFSQISF